MASHHRERHPPDPAPRDTGHDTRRDGSARADVARLGVDLDRVWTGVAGEISARRIGAVERIGARLLHSPGLARALTATPSLVLSWVISSAIVLALGIITSRVTGVPWVPVLTPALAAAGIAYAYGPGIDPAFELSQSMPVSDRTVLLARGLAVFGLNAGFGLAASVVAEPARGVTFAWLVPMTAVAALALAVATVTRSPGTGVSAALGAWLTVILVRAAGTRDFAAAAEPGTLLPVYLAATVGCIALALRATAGSRNEVSRWP